MKLLVSAVAGALLLSPAVVAAAPASAAVAPPTIVDGMVLDAGGQAIVTDVEQTDLAPGLRLTSFERIEAIGYQQIDVLVADLADPALGVDYLHPGAVAANQPVSEMVDERGGVAGVNGDFFDINNSNAAEGFGISDELGFVKSANGGDGMTAAFDTDGVGRLARLFLEGSVTVDAGELPLAGVNAAELPAGGIGLFTSLWGDYTRARPVGTETGAVEVLVADGAVVSVGAPGAGRLPEGTVAVVAREGAAATTLGSLQPGDAIEISYGLREDAGDVAVAIGGRQVLLTDGQITAPDDVRHPRTAIGFADGGRRMYLVTVDGRTAIAAGMTLVELAALLRDLGATDAMNLDGGGSTTMAARVPGDQSSKVVNVPSDGSPRRDSNGLGLFVAAGSGQVAGYSVRTDPIADADRVFPGLHRSLTALGFDETLAAVPTPAESWASSAPEIAAVAGGTVTGVAAGAATVTAATGAATGSLDLRVLGDLERVTVAQPLVALSGAGDSETVVLTGHDALGYTAPIEAGDVTVTGADGLLDVQPAHDGTVRLVATEAAGGATLTFTVGDVSTRLAVTVSLVDSVVADFSDAAQWTSANDRAPGGTVAPGAGSEGRPGLTATYNFTQSTGTRGQYAVVPGGARVLPGQPQRVTMWVKGDGNGSWLRLQVRQANGVTTQLDGPNVTWTGWQKVTFNVPASLAFPLTLQRLRILETVAARQYIGQITFSELAAGLAPQVEVPVAARVDDPLVVPAGSTDDDPLRVAVLSDAQFVARDPNSGQVAGARDALREIVAAQPDVLVINGDFVDEASPADFDLARTILTEELAGVSFPWYYVPGNHEVMGGPIGNFVEEFGATTNVFDIEGTRLITLNSSTGRLAGDFAQLQILRQALDEAAADDAITGVLVFDHHPIDDPLPTKASQLSDRHEAAMLRDWLEDFREESGKSAANISAHAGVFHSSTVDGVPYVINGNSGKNPASTPDAGGFTGWTMLGIDPADGAYASADEPWLEVEVNARVDSIALTVPAALTVGQLGDASATFVQDGTRVVPVDWPVSATWGGQGVFVGPADAAPIDAVVALDPATGALTALRVGTADVTVTVNDGTSTSRVVVGSEPEPVVAEAPFTWLLALGGIAVVVVLSRRLERRRSAGLNRG